MRSFLKTILLGLGIVLTAPLFLPSGTVKVRAQLSTGREAAEAIPPHGYVVASKAIKGSDIPGDYTFVLTRDEIYVPILVRKPKGNGPFPAITMGWGEGREGMKKVEQNLPDSISGDRRMLKSGPTLDHEDLIAIIKYLQTVPYIDKNAVGAMGVSHSGEMIMKASSEYDFAAGVCIEPADHEFLTVNTGPTAPRKDNEIQYNDIEVARKNANKPEAMERIQRIHTPILIFGRDTDHQQGIFKLTYEWMKEAGKDVQWASFDHPVHGYVFILNQPNGSYKPDEIQQKTFQIFMDYFDKHLKH